ncbi:response regulator, partial [Candidatus Saccharibacteria bacterium]|nr:response regulator [Candidatus Saccharibacteria bacterium]NIV72508.1 response regulator [Calditrichia bacterium]NIW79906.1 response regulator [Calditrichia bacterium]
VLNNLILNADQAMPEGGTINLIAENFERHNDPNLPLPAGKYIKITIKDQGVGIPKQHLKKIFDPYFTTKSKGSGLGLANTYSIIKKHNGLIEAESEAGKGATFTIYLPASPNQPVPSPEQAEPMVEGEGKVLVMDDDMVISEVFETMLKRLGYRVYLTRHGSETVDLYKQAKTNDSPFDAVILDLTIPGGMGGKETMRELLKLDPEVRAIVCSGYTNHPVLSNYKDYGFKGCIVKPFNLESIGKALGQTLHKHHQN